MTNDGDNTMLVADEAGEAWEMTRLDQPVRVKGRKPQASDGFVQVWFQEMLRVHDAVSKGAFRMLATMATELDYERTSGLVTYDMNEVMQATGIAHSSTASRMLGELEAVGAVRRVGRGRIVISPLVLWCGTAKDRAIAIFRWQNGLDHKSRSIT